MPHRASCRDLSFGLGFGQGVWEMGLSPLSTCFLGEDGCCLQWTPGLSMTSVFSVQEWCQCSTTTACVKMDHFCRKSGFTRPLCWGIEVVFWLVSFLGCSLVTVSGFRMYFIRSNSIAGGQLPCCSWTRAPSFIRSVPGCARCLSGCRAYSSRQTDGDSEGQSSGDLRPWSRCLPSRPWQQLPCLPLPPQAVPFVFLSSTCVAHHPLWLLSDTLTPLRGGGTCLHLGCPCPCISVLHATFLTFSAVSFIIVFVCLPL